MSRIGLVLGVSLLLLVLSPAAVTAQGEGIIEGQVMNGTAGASQVSLVGLEVTLYDVTDGSEALLGTTFSDGQGRFQFEGLATDPDRTYEFQLEYQGIVYGAQSAFPEGETLLRVAATIYETTSDDSGIVVERQHVLIDFEAGAVVIRELCVLNNTADTIYVGQEGITVQFSLPSGAEELSFSDAEEANHFVEVTGGFAYVRALAPGQRQVLYAYQVPYDGQQLALSRRLVYPTNSYDAMIADVGVEVESPQLEYQSLTGGEETAYLHFSGQNLPADSEVVLTLSGAAQGVAAPAPVGFELDLGLQRYAPGIALLMVLLGAALPLAQVRLGKGGEASAEANASGAETRAGGPPDTQSEGDELAHLIADLDDAYAEGLVDEQAYKQLRARMEQRLREIRTG